MPVLQFCDVSRSIEPVRSSKLLNRSSSFIKLARSIAPDLARSHRLRPPALQFHLSRPTPTALEYTPASQQQQQPSGAKQLTRGGNNPNCIKVEKLRNHYAHPQKSKENLPDSDLNNDPTDDDRVRAYL